MSWADDGWTDGWTERWHRPDGDDLAHRPATKVVAAIMLPRSTVRRTVAVSLSLLLYLGGVGGLRGVRSGRRWGQYWCGTTTITFGRFVLFQSTSTFFLVPNLNKLMMMGTTWQPAILQWSQFRRRGH